MNPTVEQIRERWSKPMPQMVFSGHAKMDIDMLFAEIERLNQRLLRLRKYEEAANFGDAMFRDKDEHPTP